MNKPFSEFTVPGPRKHGVARSSMNVSILYDRYFEDLGKGKPLQSFWMWLESENGYVNPPENK